MKNSFGQPKQKTDHDVCLWAEEQEKYRKLKRKPNKKTEVYCAESARNQSSPWASVIATRKYDDIDTSLVEYAGLQFKTQVRL